MMVEIPLLVAVLFAAVAWGGLGWIVFALHLGHPDVAVREERAEHLAHEIQALVGGLGPFSFVMVSAVWPIVLWRATRSEDQL